MSNQHFASAKTNFRYYFKAFNFAVCCVLGECENESVIPKTKVLITMVEILLLKML